MVNSDKRGAAKAKVKQSNAKERKKAEKFGEVWFETKA